MSRNFLWMIAVGVLILLGFVYGLEKYHEAKFRESRLEVELIYEKFKRIRAQQDLQRSEAMRIFSHYYGR